MRVENKGLGDAQSTQSTLNTASTVANLIPVYGTFISGALKVLGFASGLFGSHHTDWWAYADIAINNDAVALIFAEQTKKHTLAENDMVKIGLAICKNILQVTKQFNGTVPKRFYLSFDKGTKYNSMAIMINSPARGQHNRASNYEITSITDATLANLTAFIVFDLVNRGFIKMPDNIAHLFKVSGVNQSNGVLALKTIFERAKQIISPNVAPVTSINSTPANQTPVTTNGNVTQVPIIKDDTFSNKNLITYGIGIVGLLIAAKKD